MVAIAQLCNQNTHMSRTVEAAPCAGDPVWVARQIRAKTLELTLARDGCYLSQALSSAEILATLYTRVLRLAPVVETASPPFAGVPGPEGLGSPSGGRFHGPRGPETDRFLISPAHYAVAVYAALAAVGRLEPSAFDSFNVDGSTLEMIGAEHSPGFELTTGSFGQALSQAGGIAMARRLRGETGRTIVFMSDGELEEGQTWEAIQALAFYKMDKVVAYVDVNGQQVDGYTKDVMNIEPIAARLRAFGASVVRVDGHDPEALEAAAESNGSGQPVVVLCYTNSAQGMVMLEEHKPHLHYVRFRNRAEIDLARTALAELHEAM